MDWPGNVILRGETLPIADFDSILKQLASFADEILNELSWLSQAPDG